MDSKDSKLSLLRLPEELVEEILSRLAVKSLLRFRCVSKSWRSLIGSERFIKTHLQNSSKNTALDHRRLIHIHDSMSFTLGLLTEFVQPVGCCNGLVCFLKQGHFVLWNPATKISNELPQIVTENGDIPSFLIKYGFGWDESSGAYKVFVDFSIGLRERMCKVYSSKTNSWKTVEYRSFGFVRGGAQVASGKLYWQRMKSNGGMNVVTFDLKSEEFGEIELPCDSIASLGVLEGCLCVFSYNKRTHFDVWIMKEDSWVKVMDVPVYEPRRIFSLVKRVLRGLNAEISLIHGSAFLVHKLNLVEEDVLSLLDVIKRSLKANIYFESLVSPVFDKV